MTDPRGPRCPHCRDAQRWTQRERIREVIAQHYRAQAIARERRERYCSSNWRDLEVRR